jgi:16S rRNA (cytidine1402-2'-O)-methyltransferase
MKERPGVLYLVPNLIAPGNPALELPPATIARLGSLRRFVVEGEKSAWRLLSSIMDREVLALVTMELLDEHTDPGLLPGLLAPLLAGEDLGLVSEAGMPCVADPGAPLVALAQDRGIRVVPLVGPSSILLALAASGLDGQHWSFLGYLPSDREGRRLSLEAMDKEIRRDGATRIFIEAPYRNDHLLADCLERLGPDTRLCVAHSIGSAAESILSATVAEWKKRGVAIGKVPAIFLAGGVPPVQLDRARRLRHS